MKPKTFIAGKSTGITIGLLIAILSGVTWTAGKVVSIAYDQGVWRTEVKMELEAAATARLAIQVDLATMQQAFKKAAAAAWHRQDTANYHDMIDRLNPDIEIPPVPGATPGK